MWLFRDENANSTVIAHNGSGYDYKFVLKWCLERGERPSTYICQGSHITSMKFRRHNLNFVDSLNFFLSPLADLSKTDNIDTIKGFPPHNFNRPEHQNYIGPIPKEEEFGVKNMSSKQYEEFSKWYKAIVQENQPWNFREEFTKYCKSGVALLCKAVLVFRKLFRDLSDGDPWRYSTVASLSMAIYRARHLQERTIVGNAGIDRRISTVSKEWLIHSAKDSVNVFRQEIPLFIEKCDISTTVLNEGKDLVDDDDAKPYYFTHSSRHRFIADAYCPEINTVK